MNRIKFLEIRDVATFIPAIAVDMSLSGDRNNDYLLRRAGYGLKRCILLTTMHGGRIANYEPFDWGDRTWQVAHQYIEKYWGDIADGDVIDVEHILGERSVPKRSERYRDEEAAS